MLAVCVMSKQALISLALAASCTAASGLSRAVAAPANEHGPRIGSMQSVESLPPGLRRVAASVVAIFSRYLKSECSNPAAMSEATLLVSIQDLRGSVVNPDYAGALVYIPGSSKMYYVLTTGTKEVFSFDVDKDTISTLKRHAAGASVLHCDQEQ